LDPSPAEKQSLDRALNADKALLGQGTPAPGSRENPKPPTSGSRKPKILSSDKRTAERLLADIIRERNLELAGLGSQGRQDFGLSVRKQRYLESLAYETTDEHVARVAGCISRILEDVRARRVCDLSPDDVLMYRQARVQHGVANSTANKEVGALQAMLNWASRVQLISHNPVSSIRSLPQNRATQRLHRRALSADDVSALLEAARTADVDAGERKAASRTQRNGSKGRAYETRERPPRVPQTPMWLAFLETGARFKGADFRPMGRPRRGKLHGHASSDHDQEPQGQGAADLPHSPRRAEGPQTHPPSDAREDPTGD
jgi:hypothetical protein